MAKAIFNRQKGNTCTIIYTYNSLGSKIEEAMMIDNSLDDENPTATCPYLGIDAPKALKQEAEVFITVAIDLN